MAKKEHFDFDLNTTDAIIELHPFDRIDCYLVNFMSIIKSEEDHNGWYDNYDGPAYTVIKFCCSYNYCDIRNSDWVSAAILNPEHKGSKIFTPGRCVLRLYEDTLALIEPIYDVEKGRLRINVKYV